MKSIKLIVLLLGFLSTAQLFAADPTVQASNVSITARGQNYLTVSWSRGNGNRCLVVCKPFANSYSYPVDGYNNSYNSSSAYGSGDNLGNSNYVVADMTGTSLTILGLAASTQYTVVVYEYNINVILSNDYYYYLTTATSSNTESAYTLCTNPTVNATNVSAGSVTYNSATVSWATGNSTYTLLALDNYSTGSSYATPVDGTAYTASSVYGSGSLLTGDNRVVYNSTGTSVAITNLMPATTYRAMAFEFCGSSTGATWNYMTNSGDDVFFTTLNNQPTLNALSNVTVCQNSSAYSVSLAGISDGSSLETQTVSITATSSNTTLIPNGNISISYTNPNTTGTLSFTPATNQFGTSTITVTANDGFSSNNTIVRTFTVTVNPFPGSSGSIGGSTYVCKNGSNYIFTCSAASNATGYTWNFPSGTVIVSGNNTNNITVNFPSSMTQTSASISVYATNGFGCGNGSTSAKTIYFDALPTVADAGPDQVICNGTTQLEANIPNPDYGYWNVDVGTASIIDGSDPQTNVTGIASGQAVTLSWTIYSYYGVCPSSVDQVIIDYDPTNSQCLIYSDFIASNTTPCLNSTVTFTDNSVGASSYNWNFGAGASPTTSTLQNPVVTYTTPGLHSVTLTVTGTNGNDTETKSNYINVLDVPGNAGAIMGLTTVCAGDDQVIYSVGTINNATTYTWNLPSGAIVNSGSGTNAISVNYNTNATSGPITVQGENVCGTGGVSTLNITVNPLPANSGSIVGSATVCQGETGVTYSVPTIANATSYNWSVPNGANIVMNSSNTITVDYSASAISGDIIVYGTNACGDGVSDTLQITVNPLPGIAGSITGNANITNCPVSTGVQYSIAPVNNATNYMWNVPSGATINGNGSNTITVDFAFGANSGNISVMPQNACGNGTSNSLPIIVDDPVSQNICLVTVDDNSNHNTLVWEKNETPVLASYNIYKEITTGVYNLIGNVHKDSISMYDDLTADPNVTSHKYKITALDTCGNESPQSDYHSTIHLQFLGNGNLQWTLYEIENNANPVSFYKILRDDSTTGNWNVIDSLVPGGNSTYTDTDYNLFTNPSYRVDVVWLISCSPSRAGVNTSRSNVKNAPISGSSVEELNMLNKVKLYPNPSHEDFRINGIEFKSNVTIFNAIGQPVKTLTVQPGEAISIEELPVGMYSVKMEWLNYQKIMKFIKN